MNPSDSFHLDENLARLLAAYDQAIDGADAKAPTIDVPRGSPLPGERSVTPMAGNGAHEGSLGELLPGPETQQQAFPTPVHTPAPINGPHRIGRFELRRQLGKGGCGIVFLAFDPKLEREVALKIPRPEMLLSPDARRRLVREALAAAEFDHPNLVPVYETGEIGPVCFIATAFCPGQTLGEWLDRQAFPVPVRQTARLIATVAEAVQHAHDRGVLHRDLKPNNVILQATKDDPDEQEPPPGSCQLRGEHYIPRVVDFGLAKLMERGGPSETTTRQILGTPKYMAPEQAQARHDDVGPTADVYALGVILYEMLSGRAPFEGATDVEVLRQAIDGQLIRPREIRADVPRDLEAICLKAMERAPGQRYRTAIDLADDLRRFLDGKPTIARPLKWSGRAARWLRRNDQAVALVVLTTVTTVLLAMGSWSMYETRQARSDRDSALRDQADRTRADQRREYAKAVRSAFLAWRSGDVAGATEYLESARRLARTGGEATDFAHDYLTRMIAAPRLMIICPAGPVTALAVSEDGKRLASGHTDGTVAIWDRNSGDLLASVAAHKKPVTHVVFALSGTQVFTVAEGGEGHGWAVTPAWALVPASGPRRAIGQDLRSLAISPDGKTLYAGTLKGELRALDLRDPKGDRAVQFDRLEPLTAIAVSEDGVSILVGESGGDVHRMSAALNAGVRVGRYRTPVTALADVRGGFVVGFRDGADAQGIGDWVPLHGRGPVGWIASTPSGFALSNGPGRVTFSGRELATGDTGVVRAGVATRDGKTLFTGSEDGIIREWSLPGDLLRQGVSTGREVTAVAVDPDGQWFAVGTGRDLTLRFGSKDGRLVPTRGRGFAALRIVREGPPEGTLIAVEFRDAAAIVCEPTGNVVIEKAQFPLPDRATPVSAELSEDATRLVVGDDRGRVFVWDVKDRTLVTIIECGHRRPVTRLSLSDNARFLAAPSAEGVSVWAIGEAKPLSTVAADDQTVFRLLPGGDRLATASRAGVVHVWHSGTGRDELTLHGHVGRVTGLGVSPDGRVLVSGGATGEVRFWDLRTGQELLDSRRHSGPVTVIEFAAHGKLLVTGGQQLAVWDLGSE